MWMKTPPHTLVIACSDGRIWRELDALLAVQLGVGTYDRLSLPGGPAALFRGYGEARAAASREALEFLVEQHAIRHLVCVFHGASEGGPGHAQCGDYARRTEPAAVAQRRDAARVARAFSSNEHLRLTILFAEVGQSGLLHFQTWAPSPAAEAA